MKMPLDIKHNIVRIWYYLWGDFDELRRSLCAAVVLSCQGKAVVKSVCTSWKRMGRRYRSTLVLNFGTRWLVVSFTSRPLYLRERHWYPVNKRLCEARAGLDFLGKRNISCLCHIVTFRFVEGRRRPRRGWLVSWLRFEFGTFWSPNKCAKMQGTNAVVKLASYEALNCRFFFCFRWLFVSVN
jgi:hypothetical protein